LLKDLPRYLLCSWGLSFVSLLYARFIILSSDFLFWNWLTCSRNNICVKVTSYPIKLDHTVIKKIAKKHSVKLVIRAQAMNKHTWCRLPKDINGGQDIWDNIKLCLVANFCIFLKEGKLSTCCLPLLADRFNTFFEENITISENDYIDIYKAKTADEIYNFLCKPMPFCRYCKIRDWEVGIEWGVSKKEFSEWFDRDE
jgi:hypothetical protein